MTTATEKRAAMYAAIQKHGAQLLEIFPGAIEQDPVKLCKRLRKQEGIMARACVAYCNGEIQEEAVAAVQEQVSAAVSRILCDNGRVWVNRDPRGYSLKIDLAAGEVLHQDWGGYGIIAPDLTPGDED